MKKKLNSNTAVKNNISKKRKQLPNPFSYTIVLYLVIVVGIVIFLYPYATDYIKSEIEYGLNMEPELVMLIFLLLLLTIPILWAAFLFVYRKEKNRNSSSDEKTTLHGQYDEDRSYLEQQINELTTTLMDNEKRWQEINQMILYSHEKNSKNSGDLSPYDFLKSYGITKSETEIEKDLVFVLTSFHEEFISEYEAIKQACWDLKLRAIRSDEDFIRGDILPSIIKSIAKSRVVIANLNGRNPNVFYELGIAHAMSKPSILISRVNNENMPFDITAKYVIFYRDEVELKLKLQNALKTICIIGE